ncbi:MAG: transketolase [Aestuariivita sp.]|nr:transketolase [Aestuariivita sp.]
MDLIALRKKNPDHWFKAAAIRTLALDAIANAQSGHSGMPMGFADVATVLFEKHLKFFSKVPDWPDRDRFILSAGHGSMLLYALLYLCDFPKISLKEIKQFRQWRSFTAGHPESVLCPGIETTTGPLGQGLANAVGFAIAEVSQRARWGSEIVDHHTYVVAGDGCLMEGISQEAISLAGQQKLNKLILLWDNNNITIDGKVSLSDCTDQVIRFQASGWQVQEIDGHDPQQINEALISAKNSDKPSMIACKTHLAIGHAAQDTAKGHGALLNQQQILDTKKAYGWRAKEFEIPVKIKKQWENIGHSGIKKYETWKTRFSRLSKTLKTEYTRVMNRDVPQQLKPKLQKLKKEVCEKQPRVATRVSSQEALNVINALMPETIGGSADLTGSNNTLTSNIGIFDSNNRDGRYIHYGIREHAMAAVMNGLALHGGIRPYGGTFLCFADYARPAIRLAALMKIPIIYVMTHDSIGLGEDGPTHQPIEHLAMLRATPNLLVFRPADTIETIEAWEIAIHFQSSPSLLSLSRQTLPTVRRQHQTKNLTLNGAYILREAQHKLEVVLLATGSEVSIALNTRQMLEEEKVGTRVVSIPCWELFEKQDQSYRQHVLPSGVNRVAIEAGVCHGWERWLLGERGHEAKSGFIGMSGFGASAPADDLYKNFGITAPGIFKKVMELRKYS